MLPTGSLVICESAYYEGFCFVLFFKYCWGGASLHFPPRQELSWVSNECPKCSLQTLLWLVGAQMPSSLA